MDKLSINNKSPTCQGGAKPCRKHFFNTFLSLPPQAVEYSAKVRNKGIALYLVLAVLLIVVIFANIILSFITSQSYLTHHQVKHIQSHYAAQAGINYALEALRVNDPNWISNMQNITRRFCNGCTPPDVNETNFPHTINYVDVTIGLRNLTTGLREIRATVNYAQQ